MPARGHHILGSVFGGSWPGWIVEWLLDAGRPLALVSAQLLYAGTPFLGRGAERLAQILESDEGGKGTVLHPPVERRSPPTDTEGTP